MKPSVTFITATYNKPLLLWEAAQSLFDQTRADWVWFVITNGPTKEMEAVIDFMLKYDNRIKHFDEKIPADDRRNVYMPAYISNRYFPKVETPYFAWLSDDDLLSPRFVEALAGALDADSEKDIVYGHCRSVIMHDNGTLRDVTVLLANAVIGAGTGISPNCRIDSGQMLQTKRSFESIDYRIPEDWHSGGCVDGLYMRILGFKYAFYPVDEWVVVHRRTSLSEFKRG